MKVTTKISVDTTRPNTGARVDAIQWDENTRDAEISLMSGGEPWWPPKDVEISVAYIKPDRTKGMYSLLPDGTQAAMVYGSTVTVTLARQMLAVPGIVNASIVFSDADLNQLTTFPFTVHVQPSVYAGQEPSQDYIRLKWLEDKLDEYIQKIGGSGGSGVPGTPGKDGITPTIGDNGNWYLGDTDTGKPSRGDTGDVGPVGPPGSKGDTGASGYTPVRGTDYWTEADKAEIRSYVDNAILGGEW